MHQLARLRAWTPLARRGDPRRRRARAPIRTTSSPVRPSDATRCSSPERRGGADRCILRPRDSGGRASDASDPRHPPCAARGGPRIAPRAAPLIGDLDDPTPLPAFGTDPRHPRRLPRPPRHVARRHLTLQYRSPATDLATSYATALLEQAFALPARSTMLLFCDRRAAQAVAAMHTTSERSPAACFSFGTPRAGPRSYATGYEDRSGAGGIGFAVVGQGSRVVPRSAAAPSRARPADAGCGVQSLIAIGTATPGCSGSKIEAPALRTRSVPIIDAFTQLACSPQASSAGRASRRRPRKSCAERSASRSCQQLHCGVLLRRHAVPRAPRLRTRSRGPRRGLGGRSGRQRVLLPDRATTLSAMSGADAATPPALLPRSRRVRILRAHPPQNIIANYRDDVRARRFADRWHACAATAVGIRGRGRTLRSYRVSQRVRRCTSRGAGRSERQWRRWQSSPGA